LQSKTPERSKRVRPLARLGSGGLSSMFLIKTLPQIEVMPPCLDRPTYSKYFQIFPNVILLFSHVLFDKSTAILHLRHWSSPCYFGVRPFSPGFFFGQVVFMPSPVTQITQSRLSHLFGQPLMSPQDAPVPLIAILAQNFGSGYSQLPNPFAIQIVLSGERGRFFRFFRSEGLAPRLICKLFFQARIDYGYYMILWLLWPLLWAIIAINIHKP